MNECDLPTYTNEEIAAMLAAADAQQDEEALVILQGILDTREANRYAQDQEE
jgi:hypothetical protein